MRLIDADALLEDGIRVSYAYNNDGIILIPMGEARRSIKNAPTIDAVPVVRCKECRFRGNPLNCLMCNEEDYYDEDDGFDYIVRDETVDEGYCQKGERGTKMSNLISREALMEYARNHIGHTIDCNDIARFPAIDAEPVRHGHWVKCQGKSNIWYCSECGEKINYKQNRRTYNIPKVPVWQKNKRCRCCGAKMGGAEDD